MRGKTVAFIGTGFMARAMIGGIVSSGILSRESIFTVNPVDRESAAEVAATYGVRAGEAEDLALADTVIFAFKPQQFGEAIGMYGDLLTPDKLYLSIMAGVTLGELEDSIPGAAVVRLMPNLALSVKKSAIAYTPGERAADEDCALVERIFSTMGVVLRVGEDMMSSVTALSGSGPAYFCLLAEALSKAAQNDGMDAGTADALALQTLLGTAALLDEMKISPAELRKRVTSKKGTTEAGVNAMEASGFLKSAGDGFRAAKARSDELGKKR